MFVKTFFKLDDYTCSLLRDMEPVFGYDGYGEFIFYRTYSRNIDGRQEDWADIVIRNIEGVLSIRKDWYIKNYITWDERYWQGYGKAMAIAMFKMEWLPAGRGLWIMGTPFLYERGSMAANNCFSGDTKFYANGSVVKFEDVVGQTVKVLCRDHEWRSAKVKEYGIQKFNRVVFKPHIGKSNIRLVYHATKDHRWFLANGEETNYLKQGDTVTVKPFQFNVDLENYEYNEGYVHGLIFADGTQMSWDKCKYKLRLCNWKNNFFHRIQKSSYFVDETRPKTYSGDIVCYLKDEQSQLKCIPNTQSLEYKKGFIDAVINFDGHPIANNHLRLDTTSIEFTQWVIDNAVMLGYVPIGHSIDIELTNFGERNYPLNRIILTKELIDFQVEHILYLGEEKVYCVEEPVTHSFTLAGGVPSSNCGYTDIGSEFERDLDWLMDALMLGVGVGFRPTRDDDITFHRNRSMNDYVIPDSREGWVESVYRQLKALHYNLPRPRHIYDEIRTAGQPIKGFGGVASGPEPLMYLHEMIDELTDKYMTDSYYDSVMFKMDIANLIGVCVVAGNVRRSAELSQLSIKDPVFKDMKDYRRFPYRLSWGWMSNNAVDLEDDEDFEQLGDIAERVKRNGEPGYKNLQNFKYGRIGKNDPVREDDARDVNPCRRYNDSILTPEGIRKFGTLKEGDKIWSEMGWTTVIKFWSTGINKVYKYTTTGGIFYGTENHRILQNGMKCPVKNAGGIDTLTGSKYWTTDIKEFDPQHIMDGLVQGDGTWNNGRIILFIGQNDTDYFDSEIKHLIKSHNDKTGSYVQTNICELPRTYERKIPDEYYYAPKKKVAGFLRGLYSANGSICGNRVTLKAASFDVIERVQVMLSILGIRSYWTRNKPTYVQFDNGEYLCKESFDLNISTDRTRFAQIIGFIQNYKQNILEQLIENLNIPYQPEKITYDIIATEYLGEEETFDITVDNFTHTFWSAGLNNSNCLVGETSILLADGRGYVPIASLEGGDVDVYCVNERDEIVIRRMRHVRKTGESVKIYKVIFDNGDEIRVTANHRFMLQNRTYREAINLVKGDQLAALKRYTPVNCSGESYFDKYISLSWGSYWHRAEHRVIGEKKFNAILDDEHVHHIDEDRLNNHLELKIGTRHLSDHSSGETNGWTNEDVIQFGVNLAKKLGRRFSVNEWKDQGLVELRFNNSYRQQMFPSFAEFAWYCANTAEVLNEDYDTRVLRHYNEMIKLGYETSIISDRVFVHKICEVCKNEFTIEALRREQAVCSHSCNNKLRDYSLNQEGQRQYFQKQRENTKQLQADLMTEMRNNLGKWPTSRQFLEEAKDRGIPHRFGADGSPFNDLKYFAWTHNHRVYAVVEDGYADVYNGTVDEFHNFFVGGWEKETPFGRRIQIGLCNAQCGESILFNKELCNQAETLPTMVNDPNDWLNSCEYATMYASSISLLPTHRHETNRVIARNRRITVGIIDFASWKHTIGVNKVTKWLRRGYDVVTATNKGANAEAGVPEAIRKTTIKPGGTTPKIAGKIGGIGHPTFKYTLRRTRVAKNSSIHPLLVEAGIPYEPCVNDQYTDIFAWPILQGPAPPAEEISLWEQAMNLVLVQREWADNAVSNTLYFKPKWVLINILTNEAELIDFLSEHSKDSDQLIETIVKMQNGELAFENEKYRFDITEDEDSGEIVKVKIFRFNKNHEEDHIEPVLSAIAPLTKTVSLLPHSAKGVYKQMPEEGISEEEYSALKAALTRIDWSKLSNHDGEAEFYCQGDACERPIDVK